MRMWNYMDTASTGAGDLGAIVSSVSDAAGDGRSVSSLSVGDDHRPPTADHVVQVFWLASNVEGSRWKNPRQVSAYHYPRIHGPVSPTFARIWCAPDHTLLISGTAIVGHVSQHHDDAMAQLEETVRNLSSFRAMSVVAALPSKDLLKVYVRDPA